MRLMRLVALCALLASSAGAADLVIPTTAAEDDTLAFWAGLEGTTPAALARAHFQRWIEGLANTRPAREQQLYYEQVKSLPPEAQAEIEAYIRQKVGR